LQLHHQHR